MRSVLVKRTWPILHHGNDWPHVKDLTLQNLNGLDFIILVSFLQ